MSAEPRGSTLRHGNEVRQKSESTCLQARVELLAFKVVGEDIEKYPSNDVVQSLETRTGTGFILCRSASLSLTVRLSAGLTQRMSN